MSDSLAIPTALHRLFTMQDKIKSSPSYAITLKAKAKHLSKAQDDARDLGLVAVELTNGGFYDDKGLVVEAQTREYTDDAIMCMAVMRELQERTGLSMAKLGEQVDNFVAGREVKVPYFANRKDNYVPVLESKSVASGDTVKVMHNAFTDERSIYNGKTGIFEYTEYGAVYIRFTDGQLAAFDPEKVWHVI